MQEVPKILAGGEYADLRLNDFLMIDFETFFENYLKLNEKGFQSESNKLKAS